MLDKKYNSFHLWSLNETTCAQEKLRHKVRVSYFKGNLRLK